MIKLDSRLQAIFNEISVCDTLLDIGCDHGKISVSALVSGKANMVIASDISAASLAKAKILAESYNLSNIKFVVSDGFSQISDKIDTVVIAGMGGREIVAILKNATSFDKAILMPHQDSYFLREYLNGNYNIEKDYIVEENGKFYPLITISKGSGYYSPEEVYVGKNYPHSKDFINYLRYNRDRIKKILKNADISELTKELGDIEKYMEKVKDICSIIENFAPLELQDEHDNCGLLYGDLDMVLDKILVTLDTTEAVVAEAVELGCNMIIEHHPLLFNSLKHIDLRLPKHKALCMAIQNKIAVYSAHTNLDYTENGLNDYLMQKLKLTNIHKISGHDSARIGELASESTLEEFSKTVGELLNDTNIMTIGNLNKKIKTVSAINGGGGSSEKVLIETFDSGADVFLTGDVKYKVARLSKDLDYAIISYGHYNSEVFFADLIKDLIEKHSNVKVLISEKCTNPYNQ